MPDNRLQMIAELIDKVSPTAKKMEQAFKGLQNAAAKDLPAAFKKYQTAVNANEVALKNYGKRHEGVRRELRAFQEIVLRVSPAIGRLTESLGSFATGSGAAVTAVGAMGAALFVAGKFASDFATSMRAIKFGSAESGLGTLQIKQMQMVLKELGVSEEQTTAAFISLQHTMVDASRNTGEFLNSIGDPRFREYAQSIIQMSVDGRSTAEVFLKIADQIDEIKAKFPGATGVDIAGRYLESLHLPKELARTGGQDLRERLAVQERLGTTGAEMKEAQVQAELLRDKLFRGGIILDRWGVILKTDITNAFLKINDLLDKIDAKYNALFGGGRLYAQADWAEYIRSNVSADIQ